MKELEETFFKEMTGRIIGSPPKKVKNEDYLADIPLGRPVLRTPKAQRKT
jgi:hypothetical protein